MATLPTMAPTILVSGLADVAVTSPLAPEFDELAKPLIGRVADIGLQLKPLLVIVTNQSAKTLVSFSKTWRVTFASGRVHESRDHTSFPDAVCGDILEAGRSHGMAPGVRRVEAKGLVIQGWGDYPGGEYYDQFLPQFVAEKDQLLKHATELRIELNAAIFADGTLLGPDDDSWLADLFSSYVKAKQDWYRMIIDALDAGKSVSEAYRPVEHFMEDVRARMRARRPIDRDNPNAIWVQQAAADAMRWRRRHTDAEIPQLLKDSIRLDPFEIRRRI
jgi:hypothetical protein